MISYDRQTVDNPSLIKRLSHRARYGVAVDLIAPAAGSTVLDYGTGDGLLLSFLHRAQPQARYIGFEPITGMSEQARELLARTATPAQLLTARAQLEGLQCERLSCMEVLEHLDDAGLARAFSDFRGLLAPQGQLIISVPLEIGLTALAKNLVRVATGQAQEGTGATTVLAAFLGQTGRIPRISRDGYIDSHLGFDYRVLRKRIVAEGFEIERQRCAPLPLLGTLVNSQIFWLCRRR